MDGCYDDNNDDDNNKVNSFEIYSSMIHMPTPGPIQLVQRCSFVRVSGLLHDFVLQLLVHGGFVLELWKICCGRCEYFRAVELFSSCGDLGSNYMTNYLPLQYI
jgi:hypothetical protein